MNFLVKNLEMYNGKKKKPSSTNGALIIDCWHVEECKSSTPYKTQVQVVQRLQCTMRYTDPDRRNIGDKL